MNNYDPMERMREIEIFGVPALFTEKVLHSDQFYPGLIRYELWAWDDHSDTPQYVSLEQGGKFMGTILTPVSILLHPTDLDRYIGAGDLSLDTGAGNYTPAEFEEKYLSPDYDPNAQQERYGKED